MKQPDLPSRGQDALATDPGTQPGTRPPAALSPTQQQIWVAQKLHPRSPLYNMAFAFVFAAPIEEERFRAAWQAAADGSDALRTRIVEDDSGQPRAVISPRGRRLDTATVEGDFLDWCRERCARPLTLDGDLVDSVLVRLNDGRTGWYLNQHHLVADAWSTVLLFRQVAAQYAAGIPSSPVSPGYYQTITSLPGGEASRGPAREHWNSRLRTERRPIPIYGRPGAPAGTASTRLTLEIDELRSRAIEDRCREAGFSSLSEQVSRFALFATLLVSWLHRISGARELGFDAPVAGRPTPAARQTLGVFIEMFPFAVEIEPGDSFRTLAGRCVDEASRLLRFALPGMSSPSTATVNSVVLNYVPASFGDFAGMPVEVEWVHPGHGDSVHAVRLQVHDFAGSRRYRLHFDFNNAVLDERLRRRSLGHFERLLDALLDGPDRPIAAVDILTAEERLAMAALNDTGRAALPRESVVTMFEAAAAEGGERIALRQGADEMSFSALHRQADAVAAALVEAGIAPGDRIAVGGRRSMQAVVAILGSLRARAAYVPLDPAAPAARRDFILRDSGARILFTGDEDAPSSVPAGIEVLQVGAVVAARAGAAPPSPPPRLDDLAYLIYTSGSTGEPKGVLVDHAGLADYLGWAARRYVRGDRLTYPLFTSLAFDLTVTSLFLPLITGGTLEIYPEPGGAVDSAVVNVVESNSVDFIKLTPSHLSLLRRIGLEGSRIRRMVVGGEDLKTSLAAAVSAQLHGQVEIHNEYGPTEAVVGCVAHLYDPDSDTGVSVPIGSPADHVRVEILNESLSPAPEGVPGELWISRFGLARGYHGRASLTDERFRPDPARPGERRYRTGDLVRMLNPTTLDYLGRIDRQLKIAGFRVEPGEVEAQLLAVPGIQQCAVIARRRPATARGAAPAGRFCVRCGLPSNYPAASFDDAGVCRLCRSYDAIKERAREYFRTFDDLRALFAASAAGRRTTVDCLMLYSGGKDSTYALCRLVDAGYSVRAFTLDNGFLSASARDNITRVTARLGVPVDFAAPPGMAAVFRDSLARFSNVCNGCFKTIYTLGMLRARELGIPIVVTGLSRGQMFETRLSGDVFAAGRGAADDIDAAVLAARKAYHRTPDAVAGVADVSAFAADEIFETVQVIDFYRYCDVGMDEMFAYLARTVPWVRPADTGRSTNCLINDLGIYVHQQERGFHNYALPYSWDVRLGHKTRDAALAELDDDIDPERMRRLLAEIGYSEARIAAADAPAALAAFYVAGETLTDDEIRRQLLERVPPYLVPTHLQRVSSIPLTINGKVDEAALLQEAPDRGATRPPYAAPEGPVAERLAGLWEEELGAERVGMADHFFALGGTSLTAMQMIVRLCRHFAIDLPLATVFTHPRLADLARVAEDRILADVESGTPPA